MMERLKALLSTRNQNPNSQTNEGPRETSHPVGCAILAEGASPIKADVVFVHGLRGHRRNTWTKDGVCWPEQLLPKEETLSHARILTFGYDANVVTLTGRTSKSSLFEHSISLLNELSRERKRDADRPIVFVAHSFGGLIVKDALDYSNRNQAEKPHLGRIFSVTRGIIFLGTPHRGSGVASLGKVVASVAQVTLRNPNKSLIRDIERNSQTLDRIQDNFRKLLGRSTLITWSFIEELEMRGIGKKIVDRDSAVIDDNNEHRDTIHGDHVGMTKFSTTGDSGYKKVLHAIEMILDGPPVRAEPATCANGSSDRAGFSISGGAGGRGGRAEQQGGAGGQGGTVNVTFNVQTPPSVVTSLVPPVLAGQHSSEG